MNTIFICSNNRAGRDIITSGDRVIIDGKLVGCIVNHEPFHLYYRSIKWYERLWYHTRCKLLKYWRRMKWYFYSRIVLFFSWLDRQASWLWRRMSKDRASYWFDAIPGWTAHWYYKSLNKLTAKTGRNLYGERL